MSARPRIALTAGDPAGVGPELAVRLARWVATSHPDCALAIYGAPNILQEASRRFADGVELDVVPCSDLQFAEIVPGRLSAKAGLCALESFRTAVLDAIKGNVDAVVTCPINKAAVRLNGIDFSGHTGFAAELCGCRDYVMVQSAGSLRVGFVTTHIALADVPKAITQERIMTVARLMRDAIRAEGIPEPRFAVSALNPHAGEEGSMGMEDELIVKPAVRKLREAGYEAEGPFPPDTLFIESVRSRFDAIISMYHDQGHIPFKMLAFDRGVNSTLGLPIIRTSVDHGTAFDIAWRGEADPGSLRAAFELALRRALARKK